MKGTCGLPVGLSDQPRMRYTTPMAESIGLFGGSFDPIHNGHLITARAVAERLSLDRVIFLPAANPPHKLDRTLIATEHRAEMVRLAIKDEPRFAFSDFDLSREGLTYTIDTVAHFQSELGQGASLYWIIGADALADLPSWHRIQDLVDACHITSAARPGWTLEVSESLRRVLTPEQIEKLRRGIMATPMMDIGATDIRNRLRAGLSVRYFVPDAVRDYIEQHHAYEA